MKRTKLSHGVATVSEFCPPETTKALDEMLKKAWEQFGRDSSPKE